MGHLIAPSLLSADFGRLNEEVEMLNSSEADWYHLDVMDGVFVPNISFGLPIIRAIGLVATKVLDVHLMMAKPEEYIEDFKAAGANNLTIHYEACTHLHSCIQKIRKAGMNAGVALNPHTSVHLLDEILPHLNQVCVMTVNPGFGGQEFIEGSLDKISRLKSMINKINPAVKIVVDGGIKLHNAEDVLRSGADVLVSGSGVFKSNDPSETIHRMKQLKTNTFVA